jgi:N6-L-threonylcarbamoyladenine synthase
MSIILGIETSCDECSASVLLHQSKNGRDEFRPLSVSTYSQIELHQPFGGVVPEVASRNHLEQIQPVVFDALDQAKVQIEDCDAIAVTNRPGLIGALLVGVTAAKALAYAAHKPLVPVHHLEGHLMSPFLVSPGKVDSDASKIEFPSVFLMVSGGHTHLHYIEHAPIHWASDVLKTSLIGRSIDDAAGEAFDKTAKLLGYPYPGGKWIDLHSKGGDPNAYELPRGLKNRDSYDFSFSGLKTAVMNLVKKVQSDPVKNEKVVADLCASIQEAIIAPLVSKTLNLSRERRAKSIVVVGGVAANSRLRQKLKAEAQVPVHYPDLQYCTDNAAMIAAAGAVRFAQGAGLSQAEFLKLNAFSMSES